MHHRYQNDIGRCRITPRDRICLEPLNLLKSINCFLLEHVLGATKLQKPQGRKAEARPYRPCCELVCDELFESDFESTSRLPPRLANLQVVALLCHRSQIKIIGFLKTGRPPNLNVLTRDRIGRFLSNIRFTQGRTRTLRSAGTYAANGKVVLMFSNPCASRIGNSSL